MRDRLETALRLARGVGAILMGALMPWGPYFLPVADGGGHLGNTIIVSLGAGLGAMIAWTDSTLADLRREREEERRVQAEAKAASSTPEGPKE